MKTRAFLSALLLANLSGEAMAGCATPATQITDTGTAEIDTVTFRSTLTALNSTATVGGLTLTRRLRNTSTPPIDAACVQWTPNKLAEVFTNLTNGTTPPSNTTFGCANWTGTLTGWKASGTYAPNTAFAKFISTTTGDVPNIAATASVSPQPTVSAVPGNSTGLQARLSNNTVCVGSVGNWQNQEFHNASGTLTDWKQGSGSTVDPTADVGTWNVSGTGTGSVVNYNYGGGTQFSFTVWDNGSNSLSFCNGATEAVLGTLKTGQGACP